MKKIILFVFVSIILYACKEEEVSTQQFVQNFIVGKWPHKATVLITRKNGAITKNDTLVYGLDSPAIERPLDTVQFTALGKYVKNRDSINYTIDSEGKNITFARDTIGTWNIKFLRLRSIILVQEKTEKVGSDTFIYLKSSS